jgi:hypothetical protein
MEVEKKGEFEITSGKVLEKMVGHKNIQYSSGQDYIVFFMHCIMEINDFVLVGLSENENFVEKGEIPQEWNASQDSWSFRYKHAQSPNTYIMKILKLGSKLMVHTMAKEDDNKIWNFELNSTQFVNSELKEYANLSPIDIMKNLGQLIDDFNDAISSKILTNVNFKRNIIKQKENKAKYQNNNYRDPDYDPLRVGGPGGRRDRDPMLIGGGVGGSDLYGVGGGFGFLPGYGTGGGNAVGPNHPMFHGGPGYPGRGGVLPGNHPAGARFDPFGPVGPGFGSHNPRPDHFRPPDWGDDMYG